MKMCHQATHTVVDAGSDGVVKAVNEENTGCFHTGASLITKPILRSVLHLGGMRMPENETWQLEPVWQEVGLADWMPSKVTDFTRTKW